ncbi:hypothetical protein WICPIJ_002660 [Wickerhamomyces pijperi]|uniref:Uncharacterized protein n=1 Tax=Wickerhamomyces pijperi TaxID=599730 RepID=A0A9P8Q970_WICPI|nr:hypothetical protein WICPIJ_002660 [Wickerhamomyces pijperi]
MVLNYISTDLEAGFKRTDFTVLKDNKKIGFNHGFAADDVSGLNRLNSYIKLLKESILPLQEGMTTEEFKDWLFNFFYVIQNFGFLYSNPFTQSKFIGDEHESFVINAVLLDKLQPAGLTHRVKMSASSLFNVKELVASYDVPIISTETLLSGLKNIEFSRFKENSQHAQHMQFPDLLDEYFESFRLEYNKLVNCSNENRLTTRMISQTDVTKIMIDKLYSAPSFQEMIPKRLFDANSSDPVGFGYSYKSFFKLDGNNVHVKIVNYLVLKKQGKEPEYDSFPYWIHVRDAVVMLRTDFFRR